MVTNKTLHTSRAWRDAFGPGFVSGPSDQAIAAVNNAQQTYRPSR